MQQSSARSSTSLPRSCLGSSAWFLLEVGLDNTVPSGCWVAGDCEVVNVAEATVAISLLRAVTAR